MLAVGRNDFLSPDYLHFQAASRSGVGVNAGVGLTKLQEALRLDGQPSEAECPYSDTRDDSWSPPTNVTKLWTRASSVRSGTPSEVLEAALLSRRALVVVARISRSFHMPDLASHVVVDDGGKGGGLHAVLIVGMSSMAGDIAFLARNSWGTEWGLEGHAWLPSAYINSRTVTILELEAGSTI
jgi:C1A family cysteine protease